MVFASFETKIIVCKTDIKKAYDSGTTPYSYFDRIPNIEPSLTGGLKSQLESSNELKADKQREISASEENSAQKQSEMDTANKVLGESKNYLSDLKAEFKSKTAEH